MTPTSKRRRVVDALAVRWTPALAARVERRLGEAIGRRRRRRRMAIVGLVLLFVGGASFALPRARELLRGRQASVAAHVARAPGFAVPPPSSAEPAAAPATAEPATPPATAEPATPPATAEPATPPATDPAATPEAASRRAAHRRLAAASLHRSATPQESVSSLFAIADAARLADRPADAVAPLTAIFTRFPGDSRAAIAAFQLGRVLADEIHDPPAAARAFESARDLAPGGPLAKDAATRAVEAHRARPPAGGATP
jgi:hypothetical protein